MALFVGKRTSDTEFKLPEDASSDPSSFEVLRVWNTAKGLNVVLKSDVWSDPAAYGIMLADLARHIANGCFQVSGMSVDAALSRVLEGLNAELSSPTDFPAGHVESNHD